ncbi:MAG: isocitrate lyase/phosphoenolpyruvate mutase family protein [Deltaproteobacteria bacterium]|nr:isocitrate lyase/phosphoenolpyruvate mutase family protein [Deltaproteobacteria bacterium]
MDLNLKTNRQSLKRMLNERNEGIILAIGVSSGMESKLLYTTICDIYDKGIVPSYISGFITYVSGYLAAASYGLPDLGYVLREQIVRQTTTIEQATWMAALTGSHSAFPIGVDIDTGYGNEPMSIVLTCRQVHRAGGQYVQIEDQYAINKSCGHMAGGHGSGKHLVSKEEMINLRIKPAVDYAKSVEDFAVMARTDAIAVEGLDSALERMHEYQEAGADILFVEAPQGEDQLKAVADEFKNSAAVNLANMIERSPHTPYKSPRELHEMGFGIGLYCIGGIMAGKEAQMNYYKALAQGDNALEVMSDSGEKWFDGFNAMIGRNYCEQFNKHFHNFQ